VRTETFRGESRGTPRDDSAVSRRNFAGRHQPKGWDETAKSLLGARTKSRTSPGLKPDEFIYEFGNLQGLKVVRLIPMATSRTDR